MAVEAAVTQYRKEMVAGFEQRTSMLKAATTKESVINGNTATFLVASSGGATAVTRGTNGQIPYTNPSNTQVSATLVEKHAPNELTNFNIFASQGNQRQIMQMASMATINRDCDLTILEELANATQDYGSGPATIATIVGAKVALGNQQVDTTQADKMWAVVSPGVMGYLIQAPEFSNSEYVEIKPFAGPARRTLRWFGINWIETPLVTGLGTASEICYMFHSDAIGYAVRVEEDKIAIGYDEKQDSSWTRATVYHGAKILQNTGIIKITHDGSAFATT